MAHLHHFFEKRGFQRNAPKGRLCVPAQKLHQDIREIVAGFFRLPPQKFCGEEVTLALNLHFGNVKSPTLSSSRRRPGSSRINSASDNKGWIPVFAQGKTGMTVGGIVAVDIRSSNMTETPGPGS